METSRLIAREPVSDTNFISQVREKSLAIGICETRRWLDDRILATTDEWHRRILSTYRDHFWAEVVGDIDAVMATLAPDPIYRSYGGKALSGLNINTTAEARALYSSLFDAGYFPAGPLQEPRLALGEWGLMVEGIITSILPGAFFALPDLKLEPATAYQASWHLSSIHPMDRATARMAGEILYVSDPITITRAVR